MHVHGCFVMNYLNKFRPHLMKSLLNYFPTETRYIRYFLASHFTTTLYTLRTQHLKHSHSSQARTWFKFHLLCVVLHGLN